MADNSRKKRELEIKERALKVQAKGNRLRIEVDKNYQKICKFVTDYPEEVLDSMDWETKEKLYAEADTLFQRIQELEGTLRKLDVEYEELRKEVNEFYGREVMAKVDTDDVFNKLAEDDEPPDAADWWKKG